LPPSVLSRHVDYRALPSFPARRSSDLYLKFLERARTEWFRHRGFEKPALFRDNLMFVVHSLNIDYRRPARLDDLLLATARVVRGGRTFFVMEQRVLRGDELICAAEVKVACVNRDSMRPAAIPDDVRRAALAVTAI